MSGMSGHLSKRATRNWNTNRYGHEARKRKAVDTMRIALIFGEDPADVRALHLHTGESLGCSMSVVEEDEREGIIRHLAATLYRFVRRRV